MSERLVAALKAAKLGRPGGRDESDGPGIGTLICSPTDMRWYQEQVVWDLPAIVRATAPLWPEEVKRDMVRRLLADECARLWASLKAPLDYTHRMEVFDRIWAYKRVLDLLASAAVIAQGANADLGG